MPEVWILYARGMSKVCCSFLKIVLTKKSATFVTLHFLFFLRCGFIFLVNRDEIT